MCIIFNKICIIDPTLENCNGVRPNYKSYILRLS